MSKHFKLFLLLLAFVTIFSFLPMALTTVPVSASSYTTTFYPDANPESTSVDGWTRQYQIGQSWATIQGGAGTEAGDTDTSWNIAACFDAHSVSNEWSYLYRSIFLFDTSGLPDNATITSATLSLYGYSKYNTLTGTSPTVNIFSSAPASDTGLAAGDYDSLGTTPFSTTIAYADWNTSGYNDFPLNSSGLAAINITGVSNFGFREATYDAPNSEAPWTSNGIAYFGLYYAEQGSGYQPKLVITYTLESDTTPPAAVNDLKVSGTTSNTITLTWTSPGDDGNTGTAYEYDIRYATSPIDESNWDAATQVSGEPTPLAAGNSQSYTVTGLSPGTTYYFAMKTADEELNWSYINCPNGTTTG